MYSYIGFSSTYACIHIYHIWMYICSPKTFPKWDQRLNPILQLDQQGCYRSRIFQCPGIDLPISLGSGNEWWRDVWISLELERILRISETLWICETYGNSFLVILTHTASLLFFLLHEDLACSLFTPSQLLDMLFLFVFCGGGEAHFDWDAEVQKYLAVSKVSL